jgi:membrane-bound serine protease (ClpP class)
MGIGAGLLVFELHIHGFGIIGVGGVMILGLGMALLVAQPVHPMLVQSSYATDTIAILSMLLIPLAALFGFLMFKAYKAVRTKRVFAKYPVGKGRAVDDISSEKEGYVYIGGEYWRAKSSTYIKSGAAIKTVSSKDGILLVEPFSEETNR